MLAVALIWLTLLTADLRLPSPASPAVVIAWSLILVMSGIALLLLSPRPTDRLLSRVALANTSIAFVLAFWALAHSTQFSTAGGLILVTTVAGWLALAVAELLGTLEEEPSTPVRT